MHGKSEHIMCPYTAHQDIHAKACHISLCQYAEISSCMGQKTPGNQKVNWVQAWSDRYKQELWSRKHNTIFKGQKQYVLQKKKKKTKFDTSKLGRT
jgi:murein L,D-transpeptidase YafK